MIKKPSEVASTTKKIRLLIAGFPGIGKTTLALSAPKPLHIDVDRGVDRVQAKNRKDYIQPNSYEELLEDLKSDLSDYDTLVFDTGGKLLDLMKPYIIRQDSKNGQKDGQTLSIKGYGAVGKEFQRLMDNAFYQLNKNVVVIFHAKEDKDGEATKLQILVEGSTKDNVWQPMDLGGFMEMYNNKRTIGFSNCERYFAKGTHGINGIIELPNLYDASIPCGQEAGQEKTMQITKRYPLGVVAAIIPFNFPSDLFCQKVPPALMMGNSIIVKPSKYNPLTLIEYTKLMILKDR